MGTLAMVGLAPAEYLDRMADRTISGGERERLEIATVLAQAPRLAILDEPTAGIDLLSLDEIVRVVRAFRDGGGTVLLITHQEEVARIADTALGARRRTSRGVRRRARGDCKEIVRDRARASAIPIVKVTHTLAKVTHEAAIGSVDREQLETLMARGALR